MRQCGAGRRRTSCGDRSTGRSYRYCVTWREGDVDGHAHILVGPTIFRVHTDVVELMKIFHCDHCGHLLFFENTACVSCGHRLAFLPDLQLVGSLDPRWRPDAVALAAAAARPSGYRLCENYTRSKVFATGRCRPTTTTRSARRAG